MMKFIIFLSLCLIIGTAFAIWVIWSVGIERRRDKAYAKARKNLKEELEKCNIR